MKTKEIITLISENGGLNITNLKNYYYDDIKHHRVKSQTFFNYVRGYIMYNYNCSKYVAYNVTKELLY